MAPDDLDRIFDAIPHCSLDAWGSYSKVGPTMGDCRGYDLAMFMKVYQEVLQMEERCASEEEKVVYFAKKMDESDKVMAELGAVERYSSDLKKAKAVNAKELKKQRSEFFEERALKMDLPLQPEALRKIDAFKKAVDSPRPPTEASWMQLAAKVKRHRAIAERMVEEDVQVAHNPNIGLRSMEFEFQRAAPRFDQAKPPPAVQHLDEIIEHVITKIFDSLILLEIEHLIPIVIKEVYNTYTKSSDPRVGKIYMEDTKRVILRLELRLQRAENALPLLDTSLFRCPVCTGPSKNTLRSYPNAVTHVSELHSSSTNGDFIRWRQTCKGIFWRSVWVYDWVPNVPILPKDIDPTGRWDLDSSAPHLVPVLQPSLPPAPNPFNGRYVVCDPTPGFTQNILYALALLKETTLGAEFKSQIAFVYAEQRFLRHIGLTRADLRTFDYPQTPQFEVMYTLHEQLVLNGEMEAFEGLRCGKCMTNTSKGKPIRRPLPLGELLEHYNSRPCHSTEHWLFDLFFFPSTSSLGSVLEGNNRARAVFDRLFVEQSNPTPFDLPYAIDVD